MFIKKIVIEKNKKIAESFNFNKNLSVANGSAEVYDIIKLLLGKHEAAKSFCNLRFFAEVWLDKTYYIRGSKNKKELLFNFSVLCEDSENDCAEEYFKTVCQSEEMDSALFFHRFKRQDYPHKLTRYNDVFKYYPNGEFAFLTNGYGLTRSFRGFVADYIKHFKPIKLTARKDLYLKLSAEGEFNVGYLHSDENIILSGGENTLYHFLSFISIADFWDRAEKIRNMNCALKPLIISTFLEQLDESVDLSDVLRKTNSLRRQTILFVLKNHAPTKYDI